MLGLVLGLGGRFRSPTTLRVVYQPKITYFYQGIYTINIYTTHVSYVVSSIFMQKYEAGYNANF